jgi:hypothetical protein
MLVIATWADKKPHCFQEKIILKVICKKRMFISDLPLSFHELLAFSTRGLLFTIFISTVTATAGRCTTENMVSNVDTV